MKNTEELIEAHKRALRTVQNLRDEAESLRRRANMAQMGQAFSLTQRAHRCSDRAFGVDMRASVIEGELCNRAEKDETALSYIEGYYAGLGLLDKEG